MKTRSFQVLACLVAYLTFSSVVYAGAANIVSNVYRLTNQARSEMSLPLLTSASALDQAAQSFARVLAETRVFSHSAGGSSLKQRAQEVGYRFRALGENLAWSSRRLSDQELARSIVKGWLASSGHRRNILSQKFTQIGIGIARSGGRLYIVQVFGRPE